MPLAFGTRNIEDLSMGYRIDVDARTGAAALRVPVPAPPGRDGFAPSLALSYSSGAGNSAFGVGWSLNGLPAIGIDTRMHVPRWDGTDGYQLGGDELVPWLERKAGAWTPRGFVDGSYSVALMRRRRGSTQLRVEKWVDIATGRIHFRTRDARNVLTIYGARPAAAARIADRGDDTRTLTWLPELQIDPHGNVAWLDYAAETRDGVDLGAPYERRDPALVQRYLKRVRYGNAVPLAADDALIGGTLPVDSRWCFQLVLDYGDHTGLGTAVADRAWPARMDPFSSFRDGFEVRTYRLCRRVLAFHELAELGTGPTLVNALVLSHDEDVAGSTLREISSIGYRREGAAVTSKAIPPLRMTYAVVSSETAFTEAPAEAVENVPAGLAGRRYTFVDLLGEGLAGILTEQDRSWYYKQNLGGGAFGAQAAVLERPATRPGTFALGDVDGNGNTELAQLAGRFAGRYELDREDAAWHGFVPFSVFPHVEALGGRAQWVDLNGDGRADVVVAKSDSLLWFASDGDAFLPPIEVPRPDGAEAAPALTSDPMLDFFFADMTGDGLADMVRVQNGRVEYWPSLGNGRFGDRVVMDGAPAFAPDAELDATRLRFIDLDGSGTSDLVYLGRGEVTCWINAAGNRLVPGPKLASLPYIDNVSSAQILDFLGDGRACLVWSTPLPGRESPLEYLPLTAAVPARLLLSVANSQGRETQFSYSSSAVHYRRDVTAGRDWCTRLPAHHPVVDRCEVIDHIGGTRSVQRYAYHDGYYDGDERTQRGFGHVDVYDAQAVAGASPEAEAFTTPSLVRTWFHLGTPMSGHHRPRETYAGDGDLPHLAVHVVDDADQLTADEIEDGLRALAGQAIRREIYAVGMYDVPGAHPVEVHQASFRLRRLQPAHGSAQAGFSVVPSEDVTWVYEQAAGDPRVEHTVLLATDDYDLPSRDVTIGYARRATKPADVPSQTRNLITVTDHVVVTVDEPRRFELGMPVETKRFELVGIRPGATGLVSREQLIAPKVAAAVAAPAAHHVDLVDDPLAGPAARRLGWDRTFYWNDTRDAPLALGAVGTVTLPHHDESACFASEFVADALGGRVADAGLLALGYVLRDSLWWQLEATRHFAPAPQFSRLSSVVRGDGATTRFTYDTYDLALTKVIDPLGNATTGVVDYHRLEPMRLTDENGNAREVRYDPLGVVVATASYGHVGDHVWGFDALEAVVDRSPPTLAAALAKPSDYLQGAATFVWYDLGAWSRDGAPTTVLYLAAEALRHDGVGGSSADGPIQIGVAYLDGLGRPLQRKHRVEAGPAIQRDTSGHVVVDAGGRPILAASDARWCASGHVIYDAKQNPLRQYDPFFSPSSAYEGDDVLQHVGGSILSRYDAVGRCVGQDAPNGTFSTTAYGSWAVEQADANDNIVGSTYGALRLGRPADDPERQAYEQAKAHAGTTASVYLDPLGRSVGELARGGATAGDRRTETRLDITGQPREIVDPRGLVAFRYRCDMHGRQWFEHSVDAGDVWTLPDPHDRVVTTWDGRGFRTDRGYDLADRPLHTEVRGGDGASALDHRVEQWVYGETLPDRVDAARRNILGRVVTTRDSAGQTSVDRYDPSGSVLASALRLRVDVDSEPDWRVAVALEVDELVTSVAYDALARPRSDTLAEGTARTYEYLPSGALSRVRLTTPDGALIGTPIVDGAIYGARGERRGLTLGNGVALAYDYDVETYRLATQTATRGTQKLQGLRYTYDPRGNLVRLVDDAQDGSGAVITGVAIPARRDYVYDAHYRLRQATGRVHQALLQYDFIPGTKDTIRGTRHITLANGAAIERFTQSYDYDASGNLRYVKHVGKTRSWTTNMWISATSNRSVPALDPGGISVVGPETKFDAAGNLRQLSHLRQIEWTFRGALARAVVIERPAGTDDAEHYVYGGDGLRARRITTRVVSGGKIETTEKVYVGDAERKRIRIDGKLIFDRWTVSVSDGAQRVARVYRWLVDDLAREVDDVAKPRITYQLSTHQGSSAIELDQVGKLISYEEYFPYGGTAFIAGDDLREVARKDFRYSGKECDDFSGLYYYGYRYYAPWMGRWLSPDPVGPKDDLDLYQFVRGNPVSNVDGNGLVTLDVEAVDGFVVPDETHGINISFSSVPLSTTDLSKMDPLSLAVPGKGPTSLGWIHEHMPDVTDVVVHQRAKGGAGPATAETPKSGATTPTPSTAGGDGDAVVSPVETKGGGTLPAAATTGAPASTPADIPSLLEIADAYGGPEKWRSTAEQKATDSGDDIDGGQTPGGSAVATVGTDIVRLNPEGPVHEVAENFDDQKIAAYLDRIQTDRAIAIRSEPPGGGSRTDDIRAENKHLRDEFEAALPNRRRPGGTDIDHTVEYQDIGRYNNVVRPQDHRVLDSGLNSSQGTSQMWVNRKRIAAGAREDVPAGAVARTSELNNPKISESYRGRARALGYLLTAIGPALNFHGASQVPNRWVRYTGYGLATAETAGVAAHLFGRYGLGGGSAGSSLGLGVMRVGSGVARYAGGLNALLLSGYALKDDIERNDMPAAIGDEMNVLGAALIMGGGALGSAAAVTLGEFGVAFGLGYGFGRGLDEGVGQLIGNKTVTEDTPNGKVTYVNRDYTISAMLARDPALLLYAASPVAAAYKGLSLIFGW